ncbi:pilus assembly protein TadG-related protein [Nocardioides sp.]|uniref:pilus assembly protein TadG-related protein n=1 Tax=Nocardioides sp. TaxID=35761 RepID=UPI0027341668|nr:pilus assembly protein TadG-related protein [Nocardioides sp.]MDP3892586.1 pilus assembly protein TadG-related protein [Nocardioides sp.]
MYRTLRARRARDEDGAIAIMVAISMTFLLVIAAMVLDFGLVRIDRQIDRSAADSATLAGLHGLNLGGGTPHPNVGVCTAARYLKVNSQRFSGLDENAGWENGLGTPTASGCSDTALRNTSCSPTNRATWARWRWTGTSRGVTLSVTIESGYDLAANPWSEDSLPASSGDDGASAYQGCDNLAVTVSQSRSPGLGSLATDSDLTTAIRSVGRIRAVPGGAAPALLLLKRTGCPVLATGSSGGSSFVRVLGALTSDGRSQAGTIHADTDGSGCTGGNNGWAFGGLASHGIVAYAAPTVGDPTAPDLSKPGSISSTAVLNGLSGTVIRDSPDHVYGSSALNGTGGAKAEVSGRSLVTRSLVDDRYFTGVKAATGDASSVFASGSSGMPGGGDWVGFPAAVNPCKPTQAQVNNLALTSASKLYVDCTTNAGFGGPGTALTINAGTIYYRGLVSPDSVLRMPNAHHVYIGNHTDRSDAISIGNNTSFELNSQAGNLAATGNCSTGQSASRAIVFVRSGAFKQTGGLLRMCRTTTVMMGGRGDACVPATPGTAPTTTPCNGGLGSGQFTQNGGGIDWTAPDTLDTTLADDGTPLPAAESAWQDPNGPEDLALWSESATSSSATYSMSGGGLFEVRGVFMVPNADPFILSGGSTLNLTNAQYIASSIRLNGSGTNVTMSVDPNTAISLPDQGLVGLVR